jgi:hypothetical protein
MKERPILFSAPMVRAILAGTKTQTRRAVKPQPPAVEVVRKKCGSGFSIFTDHHTRPDQFRVGGPVWAVREIMGAQYPKSHDWVSPYGAPGDRLWVRETWAPCEAPILPGRFQYAADGAVGNRIDIGGDLVWRRSGYTLGVTEDDPTGIWIGKPQLWRPSIHMPRKASRLDLEVTGVRVERLHDISEEDARAEGAPPYVVGHGPITDAELRAEPGYFSDRLYRNGFEDLWRSINGAESWDANPWVWVVSFRRVS